VCSTGDYCGQTGEAGLREAVRELPANEKVYWIGSEGVVKSLAARRFPWDVKYRVPEGGVFIVTYRKSDAARDFRMPSGARFLLHVPRQNGQFVEIYGGPNMPVSVAERVAKQLRPVPRD
jgi:hypothetical protein